MCVCLLALDALASSACHARPATDLPSGERGGGGRGRVWVCAREDETDGEREESHSESRRTLSHAVIHSTVHCEQTHTETQTRAQTPARHTHSHILLPRRPWGQWDRASSRVWFVCLHLIIETGLFLQPLLQLFFIFLRERARAREREREKGER